MTGAVWHWLCWLLGTPAAIAGLWMIWRGVFGDRARGRRRCPQCWYDLAGVPGLLCPECGRHARDERDLRRSRRRWGIAAIGLLLVPAGYVASVSPNLGRVGWRGFVPTTLLLWIPSPRTEPPSGLTFGGRGWTPPSDPWFAELWRRHASGSMWEWQARVLMRRDLDRVVWCREKWLAGEPLCVRVAPGWFQSESRPRVVRVTPRIEGSPSAELSLPPAPPLTAAAPAGAPGFAPLTAPVTLPGMAWRDVTRHDFPHTLAPVPAGTEEVTFDVEVREPPVGAAGGGSRLVFRGAVTKTVRALTDRSLVMEPVDSPEITEAIRRGLGVSVGRGPDGKPYIQGALSQRDGLPDDVVTGMRIEFLLGDERVAWGQFRPMAWFNETSSGWVHGDMGRVADTWMDPGWRVKVTGSIESAIRDPHGLKYWSGSFECPYSELGR